MNQEDWTKQFKATYNRKPSDQEVQEAKDKGEFKVEDSSNASSMLQNKNKRYLLAGAAVAVLGVLMFVLFGMGPKITDLDGVWVNPEDTISFVYEINNKEKKFNGEKEIKEITEGDKAKADFENFIKEENDSKIKNLADFDKHFKLNTKAIFSAYIGNEKIYHILQKDGSMIIYDSRSGINSSNDSQYIKRLQFYKIQYPRVFVGKWKFKDTANNGSWTMSISNKGIARVEFSNNNSIKVNSIYKLILYPFKDYVKLFLDDSENGISSKVVEEKIAAIKEEVEEQGYRVKSDKDIYYDVNFKQFYVVVQDGQKVLCIIEPSQLIGTMDRTK